jgi:agmatine/peptidylarginine deiminase
MHNGARKVIGVTGRTVIIVNPETGSIDWTFNDWGNKEEGEENIAVNTPFCKLGICYRKRPDARLTPSLHQVLNKNSSIHARN